MIERYVRQGGRQCGKTYELMTEIHDRIVAGERADIMVIFPAMNYLTFWRDAWNRRFAHVPMPDYTSMNAMERVRGKRIKHAYVEDIEYQDDGIYADKLDHLWPCFNANEECTITFTSSLVPLAQVSHREHHDKHSVIDARRWEVSRRLAERLRLDEVDDDAEGQASGSED